MSTTTEPTVVRESIAALYARLETDRQPFLDRARENAQLTIPALMPPAGHSGSSKLYIPWQSVGSHGVNTLSTKLVNTVIPPNSPMFRYSVSDKVIEDLDNIEARSGVEKKLNEIERAVQDEIEGMGIRGAVTEALRHLIVCGNVLLVLPREGNLKMFKLDRYVVQRDYAGNILRVIIKETVDRSVLPKDVLDLIVTVTELPSDLDRKEEKEVDLYTIYERNGDRLDSYQSIKDIKLPKSIGSWRHDKAPIMVLRWTYVSDEDYGRAYVDEYLGDLKGVEALSKALREGAAAASKINPMVNPAGLTRASDIAKAKNLQVISGRKEDVSMLQFEKQADMAFVSNVLDGIVRRLQQAFMMNASAQRDGERVTAEEIRSMIADIDTVLGGIYSLLAQDLQLPLVRRVMDRMVREKKIPDIEKLKGTDGKPVAAPKVITGVEAIGRGQDYNRYTTFMKDIVGPLGDAGVAELKISDLLRRAAVALSIDTDGLLKSDEEKAAEKQTAQAEVQGANQQQLMADLLKGATPALAKAGAEGFAAQLQGQE